MCNVYFRLAVCNGKARLYDASSRTLVSLDVDGWKDAVAFAMFSSTTIRTRVNMKFIYILEVLLLFYCQFLLNAIQRRDRVGASSGFRQ